ncbi:MAG: serine hydrolase [Cyanobacteria bacterium J06648_16]
MTDPNPYPKPPSGPSRRPPGPSRRSVSGPPSRRERRRSSSWIDQLMSSRAKRRPVKAARTQPSEPAFASAAAAPTRPPNGRRARRAARRSPAWPPQADNRLPQLPKAPRPVLYIARTLIIGIGVAAITGTLLSVLTPADTKPSDLAASQTASRTESVITAEGDTAATSTLGLTREVTALKADLAAIPELTPGLTLTLFWLDLDTGEYVNIDGQKTIAAASTVKLPILVALFEEVDAGRISLEQTMMVQPEQVAGGSGDMQNQLPGTQYTVLEVATQMIISSDNTATNMMIDLLGGGDALNARFGDWGLTSTVLNHPLPDLEGTNTTSPRDLVKVMALLHQGETLTLRSRDRVFNILQRTHNKNLLASGVKDGALVYNKTGDIGTVLGDVALVDLPNGKRYALATLVERPENDGRARELIRRLSQTVSQAAESEITAVQSGAATDSGDAGLEVPSGELNPDASDAAVEPDLDL